MRLNKLLKKDLFNWILISIFFVLGTFTTFSQQSDSSLTIEDLYFPYDQFPKNGIEDDENIDRDRLIFSQKSLDNLWQFMKGMLILPREHLIVPLNKGTDGFGVGVKVSNDDAYVFENEYTGPSFSFTNDGIYVATKNLTEEEKNSDGPAVRRDESLKFDEYRDWFCAMQDCSEAGNGCIDPAWRFNTPTFCRRELPMCLDINSYNTTSDIDGLTDKVSLVGYLHPTNGEGYITSNFGVVRKYEKNGEVFYVQTEDLNGDKENLGWDRVIYAHAGIDIGVPEGTSLYAVKSGKIVYAGDQGETGYGKFVVIMHDDGINSLYGHLSKIKVVIGETVKKGQVIGFSGNTGASTGPHLHFELRKVGTEYEQFPFATASWNGTLPCLTDIALVHGQSGVANCPSNIDPTSIITDGEIISQSIGTSIYADVSFTQLTGRIAGTSTDCGGASCIDSPYAGGPGDICYTENYSDKVKSKLVYPQESQYLDLHDYSFDGVLPEVSKALAAVMKDKEFKKIMNSCEDCKIGIYDGYRSREEQAQIVLDICGPGVEWCTGAASPGYSQHITGLAIDTYILKDGTWGAYTNLDSKLAKIMEKHGFIRPVAGDPPHFFYVGNNTLTAECGSSVDNTSSGEGGEEVDDQEQRDGSRLDADAGYSGALPFCDNDPCSNDAGEPTSLGCMLSIISELTQVPKELLYGITMIESGGLCMEKTLGEGDDIAECTGNPLQVAWSSPTEQINGGSQDIRGVSAVNVTEVKMSLLQTPELLKQCVEAAVGQPLDAHFANSTNPGLAPDPEAQKLPYKDSGLYSRHLVAHSLCFTALKVRRDGAEWNEWSKTNESITAYNMEHEILTLEQWYDNIQKGKKAAVDLNWPSGAAPNKKDYEMVSHIGRRYYGVCKHPKEISGYNRDIDYCGDLLDHYHEAQSSPGMFTCSGAAGNNASLVGGSLNCLEKEDRYISN